jgi:hypothetical protein
METAIQLLLKEFLRTLYALIYFIVTSLIMVTIQVRNDNISIITKVIYQGSLPDIVLDSKHRPKMPAGMPDWTLFSLIAISVIGHFAAVTPRTRLLLTARRFFWLLGTCYALRAVSLAGTVLPPSNPQCVYQKREGILKIIMAGLQLLVGSVHTCSDKIFSGHTIVATLLTCFWWNISQNWFIRAYPVLHEIGMIICSLSGRHHYTVDIVVALIVATTVFHLYHLLVRIVSVAELHARGPYLPLKMAAHLCTNNSKDENDIRIESLFSKYPARGIRILIKYMDGIDLRNTSDLLLQ